MRHVRRNDRCPCGSGLKFKRCCGDPATRRRQAALADARNAAAFVPTLRPSGPDVLAYIEQAAVVLGENDGNVPGPVVADAAALVSALDRSEIVSAFEAQEPEIYDDLRVTLEDELERELVTSAIRGAICDRRPVPRAHLVVLERASSLPQTPAGRLGLVLPSGAVWSLHDASSFLDDDGLACDWDRWVNEVEPGLLQRVAEWQIERVRLLAGALARNLPLASLPRASAVAARDCEQVLRHAKTARATAGSLLISHAVMLAGELGKASSPN